MQLSCKILDLIVVCSLTDQTLNIYSLVVNEMLYIHVHTRILLHSLILFIACPHKSVIKNVIRITYKCDHIII